MQFNIIKNVYYIIVIAISFFLPACSNAIQQIVEKNREEYLLHNPGALDPKIGSDVRYVTHTFKFLEKHKVSHDWPIGMDACGYSIIEIPESQQDGYWYGSYRRLGDIFEYKGSTLQEVRVNGYPERSYDASFMSLDNYVKTWKKVDELGVERTYGYDPICEQALVGASLSISVYLYSGKPKWLEKYTARRPAGSKEKYFFKKKFAGRDWLVRKKKLKKKLSNGGVPAVEQWFTPVADTGYYYSFEFFSDADSPTDVHTYEVMRKVFRHLLESLKIERLNKKEAMQVQVKVKKLIQNIEKYAIGK